MGGGVMLIHRTVHHHHKNVPDTVVDIFRQLHWARWVNWGLTHPMIIISLTLLSGLNGASLLVAVSADLIMWISGFISVTFEGHGRKWAWFTIACLAYLTVVYQMGFNGRRATSGKDAKVRRFYASISGFSLVVLAIYPM
jgi:bacteriorhodopsin